jgi:hypothetical protein
MGAVYRHLLIISAVIGITLVSLWGAAAYAQDTAIGIVKIAEGEVALLRSDTAIPVEVGTGVNLHDRLRTGANGSVGVTLDDGTLISLGPNSLFEFTEYEYVPQRGAFGFLGSVLGGTMLYSSGKIGKLAPERTKIHTPISVIAVRGTRFAVRLPIATGN